MFVVVPVRTPAAAPCDYLVDDGACPSAITLSYPVNYCLAVIAIMACYYKPMGISAFSYDFTILNFWVVLRRLDWIFRS